MVYTAWLYSSLIIIVVLFDVLYGWRDVSSGAGYNDETASLPRIIVVLDVADAYPLLYSGLG